jgi:putative PIN family toxin of toxin-antitoxin system
VRLLLDTNVLIAAFISRGACHELLAHCIYNHEPVTSKTLLREFQEKLVEKFRFTLSEARDAAALLASRLEIVEPKALSKPVSRDPDDDLVLAAAVAGDCRCLITGDKDLLVLKRFLEIRILSPAEFWKYETEVNPR